MKTPERIPDFFLLFSSTILILIGSLQLLIAITWLAGGRILAIHLAAAALFSLAALWWGSRLYFEKQRVFVFAFVMLLLAITGGFFYLKNGEILDTSIDGQMYHANAIEKLYNGWNPFRDPPLPVYNRQDPDRTNLFVDTYAKGPWVQAAAVYKLSNRIETGKMLNLMLILASFGISFTALRDVLKLKGLYAGLLSLLIALNPVCIVQSFNYYVDGQLYSLVVCVIGLGMILNKHRNVFIYAVTGFALIALINIKQTGLIYAVLLGGGFVFWSLIKEAAPMIKETKSLALAWRTSQQKTTLLVLMISFFAGIFLVGFNPYVTNTIRYHNPFYPAMSSPGQIEIMSYNRPVGFTGIAPIKRFFYSIFSHVDNLSHPARLKWPFLIYPEELVYIRAADARISGFGPWFSGALVLCFIIMTVFLLKRVSGLGLAILAFGWILVTVLINPESWWARYVPQMWLLPFSAPVLAFLPLNNHGWKKLLGWLVVAVLMVNVLLIGGFYLQKIQVQSDTIKSELNAIKENNQQVVLAKFRRFSINRARFQESGIHYQEVKEFSGCQKTIKIDSSSTEICFPKVASQENNPASYP